MTTATSTAVFPIIDGRYRMEREPAVRIGIVLEEDNKVEMRLATPSAGYRLDADGSVRALPAGDATFRSDRGRIEARTASGETLCQGAQVVRVLPPEGFRACKAGEGTRLFAVVAGRGFHWQKNIDQTITGILEFRPNGKHLVVINELPIEEYLIGVVTGEMSGECPPEFIKAQTVAARSWLLAQPVAPHVGQPFIWCNDDCCQRYQGTEGWSQAAIDAVRACHGEVLITPSNQYCDARYSKNTGGISEDAVHVWHRPIEGLVSMIDAPKGSAVERFSPVTEANLHEYLEGDWIAKTDCFAGPNVCADEILPKYLGRVDEPGTYFRWRVPVTQETLRESLQKRGGIADLAEVLDLRPLTRGNSGRLKSLAVDYRDRSGRKKTRDLTSEYAIRAAVWKKFLYSSAFILEDVQRSGESLASVTFTGAGWGHGAGLCQIGALGRSLKGQNYDEILYAYFKDVRLEAIYD